jgi:hypothetical protein
MVSRIFCPVAVSWEIFLDFAKMFVAVTKECSRGDITIPKITTAKISSTREKPLLFDLIFLIIVLFPP